MTVLLVIGLLAVAVALHAGAIRLCRGPGKPDQSGDPPRDTGDRS